MDGGLNEVAVEGTPGPGSTCISPWVRPDDKGMTRRPDVRHRFLIQEFAARAGVTVKALHLYDRLGLVIPARSEAGHRIYTSEDFRRVRHIVTLKRLGIPLRRVGAILAGHGAPLDAILHHQRRALEDRRDVLDGLIRALRQAEDAPAQRCARRHPRFTR